MTDGRRQMADCRRRMTEGREHKAKGALRPSGIVKGIPPQYDHSDLRGTALRHLRQAG